MSPVAPALPFTATSEPIQRQVPFFLAAMACGLVLTLGPVAASMALSGKSSLSEAYLALAQWDSGWYASIVAEGYDCDLSKLDTPEYAANICFFPAYPLLVKAVIFVTHWPTFLAMLITAQAACWAFWVYLLLLFRRWEVPRSLAVAGALLILLHPASFFLVAAYSESLFLTAMIGFLLWSERRGAPSWALAALHGVVMTGTRIVGVCVAVVPAIRSAIVPPLPWPDVRIWLKSFKNRWAPLLLAGVACVGLLAFVAYCHICFGSWSVYERVQSTGWHHGKSADFLAIFKPETYALAWPFRKGELYQPRIDRCLPFIITAILGLTILKDLKSRWAGGAPSLRIGIYAAAALMYFVLVSAKSSIQMYSMMRYSLVVHVLLVLALVDRLRFRSPVIGRCSFCIGAVLAVAVLVLQLVFIFRFTHARWVG